MLFIHFIDSIWLTSSLKWARNLRPFIKTQFWFTNWLYLASPTSICQYTYFIVVLTKGLLWVSHASGIFLSSLACSFCLSVCLPACLPASHLCIYLLCVLWLLPVRYEQMSTCSIHRALTSAEERLVKEWVYWDHLLECEWWLPVERGGLDSNSIAGKPTCPGDDSQGLHPLLFLHFLKVAQQAAGLPSAAVGHCIDIVNLISGISWDLEVVYFLSLENFVLMSLSPNWHVSIWRNFYTTIAFQYIFPISVKGKARDDAYVLFISPHNSTQVTVLLIAELMCQLILTSHCLRLRHAWFVFYICMTMRAAICNARSLRTPSGVGYSTKQTEV